MNQLATKKSTSGKLPKEQGPLTRIEQFATRFGGTIVAQDNDRVFLVEELDRFGSQVYCVRVIFPGETPHRYGPFNDLDTGRAAFVTAHSFVTEALDDIFYDLQDETIKDVPNGESLEIGPMNREA